MIKKQYIICFLHVLFFSSIYSQNSDSCEKDTTSEYYNSYFTFDLSFTNNNLTGNTTQSLSSAATIADVSFYYKSGVWASLMPIVYHNSDVFSSDLDFLMGYQYFFNNGFDINAYYSYHNYTGDSAFLGIDYKQSLNLSIGYEYKGLYVYIDGYSLLGTANNYFMDAGIGYYKEFDLKLKGESFLSIFPIITTTFGNDLWVYEDLTTAELFRTQLTLNNNNYLWDTFDMQSIDFMFPVSYTYGNLTGSFSYLFSVPTNKYKLLGWENQSGLMLSINYTLNL